MSQAFCEKISAGIHLSLTFLSPQVVYCMGVARVNRVLAVSRAFGNRCVKILCIGVIVCFFEVKFRAT